MRYQRASSSVISLAAVAVLSAAACNSGSTAPASELAAARTRWTRVAPSAYSYTISRSCECLREMTGPVLVTVRNGVVESRQYTRSGAAVSAQYAELFPAVEGLFAIVDDAIRNDTKSLSVQYDLALGFPTRIALGDPAADAPVYSVSDLRPR